MGRHIWISRRRCRARRVATFALLLVLRRRRLLLLLLLLLLRRQSGRRRRRSRLRLRRLGELILRQRLRRTQRQLLELGLRL